MVPRDLEVAQPFRGHVSCSLRRGRWSAQETARVQGARGGRSGFPWFSPDFPLLMSHEALIIRYLPIPLIGDLASKCPRDT